MQNNHALISIAMATYNGEKYVREQLESILHQTLSPFEIIITDDGSSDDTIAVIKEMQVQFPIIHLYQLPVNGGVNKAFEHSILQCKGDFIAIADQDDTWVPGKLELLLANIGTNDIAYGNSLLVDQDGKSLGREFKSLMNLQSYKTGAPFLLSNALPGHAMLINATFLKSILPFPKEAMFDKWISFCAGAGNGIKYVDAILVHYRQHSTNTVGVGRSQHKTARQKFEEKSLQLKAFLKAPIKQPEDRKLLERMNTLFTDGFSIKRGLFFLENIKTLLVVKNKPYYRKLLYGFKMFFKANY